MKRVYYNVLMLDMLIALTSSCATASLSRYGAVGRVKRYEIYSKDLPVEFDGLRVAFASDLHYKSKLTNKRLHKLVGVINSIAPDLVVLGGDYPGKADADDMDTLFNCLGTLKSRFGTFAIMGNHDVGTLYQPIKAAMKRNGVKCMEGDGFRIYGDSTSIIISGVADSFDSDPQNIPVSERYDEKEFVILVAHTPDYAETKMVARADLVLSGHTHGGQVSFFKKIAPVSNSIYGSRFLTGLKYTSNGVPLLITNGVGTSRKNVRIFTPSEVVLLTLYRKN